MLAFTVTQQYSIGDSCKESVSLVIQSSISWRTLDWAVPCHFIQLGAFAILSHHAKCTSFSPSIIVSHHMCFIFALVPGKFPLMCGHFFLDFLPGNSQENWVTFLVEKLKWFIGKSHSGLIRILWNILLEGRTSLSQRGLKTMETFRLEHIFWLDIRCSFKSWFKLHVFVKIKLDIALKSTKKCSKTKASTCQALISGCGT